MCESQQCSCGHRSPTLCNSGKVLSVSTVFEIDEVLRAGTACPCCRTSVYIDHDASLGLPYAWLLSAHTTFRHEEDTYNHGAMHAFAIVSLGTKTEGLVGRSQTTSTWLSVPKRLEALHVSHLGSDPALVFHDIYSGVTYAAIAN
jgi:hypothetical protein